MKTCYCVSSTRLTLISVLGFHLFFSKGSTSLIRKQSTSNKSLLQIPWVEEARTCICITINNQTVAKQFSEKDIPQLQFCLNVMSELRDQMCISLDIEMECYQWDQTLEIKIKGKDDHSRTCNSIFDAIDKELCSKFVVYEQVLPHTNDHFYEKVKNLRSESRTDVAVYARKDGTVFLLAKEKESLKTLMTALDVHVQQMQTSHIGLLASELGFLEYAQKRIEGLVMCDYDETTFSFTLTLLRAKSSYDDVADLLNKFFVKERLDFTHDFVKNLLFVDDLPNDNLILYVTRKASKKEKHKSVTFSSVSFQKTFTGEVYVLGTDKETVKLFKDAVEKSIHRHLFLLSAVDSDGLNKYLNTWEGKGKLRYEQKASFVEIACTDDLTNELNCYHYLTKDVPFPEVIISFLNGPGGHILEKMNFYNVEARTATGFVKVNGTAEKINEFQKYVQQSTGPLYKCIPVRASKSRMSSRIALIDSLMKRHHCIWKVKQTDDPQGHCVTWSDPLASFDVSLQKDLGGKLECDVLVELTNDSLFPLSLSQNATETGKSNDTILCITYV